MFIFSLIFMTLSPNTSLYEHTQPLYSQIYWVEKQFIPEKQFKEFQYHSPIERGQWKR